MGIGWLILCRWLTPRFSEGPSRDEGSWAEDVQNAGFTLVCWCEGFRIRERPLDRCTADGSLFS